MIEKPWLWLPPSLAHSLTPLALKTYSRFFGKQPPQWKPLVWEGLKFPNPLGPAGGLDKSAINVGDWQNIGAGFCEVGTVTPLPQKKQKAPNLKRSLKYKSLWNHLGFPNKGMHFVKKQLSEWQEKKIPLFVNLGKNRNTPLKEAHKDYIQGMKTLSPFADAFVINISSPNTKDLRDLFSESHLFSFLKNLKDNSENKPLLLKMSPDLEEKHFLQVIEKSIEAGINGWCLCNTTTERNPAQLFPPHGGVSGHLLKEKSLSLLKNLKKHLGSSHSEKLIISCGGVLSPEDVFERLEEGAHLVQVYSALVFQGFGFFKEVHTGLGK